MKKFLRDYFTFTKNEQRGLLALIFLMFAVAILPYSIRLFQGDKIYDNSEFEKEIAAFEKALEYSEKKKIEYFYFNPNELDFLGFQKLGLSKKQANNIIKYRKAGGVFKSPNDFSKIYSISDSLFLLLKPYIKMPAHIAKNVNYKGKEVKKPIKRTNYHNKKEKSKANGYSPPKQKLNIELNSADSLQLIQLKGIGPVFAHRILSYRYFLGGFYDTEQLMEVYGLKNETLQKIQPFITIDTSLIEKIDLNTASFKEINRHPYISYNQTKSIMNYKDLMLKFATVQEVISNHLLDSISYNRVKPYLLAN